MALRPRFPPANLSPNDTVQVYDPIFDTTNVYPCIFYRPWLTATPWGTYFPPDSLIGRVAILTPTKISCQVQDGNTSRLNFKGGLDPVPWFAISGFQYLNTGTPFNFIYMTNIAT